MYPLSPRPNTANRILRKESPGKPLCTRDAKERRCRVRERVVPACTAINRNGVLRKYSRNNFAGASGAMLVWGPPVKTVKAPPGVEPHLGHRSRFASKTRGVRCVVPLDVHFIVYTGTATISTDRSKSYVSNNSTKATIEPTTRDCCVYVKHSSNHRH